MRDSGNVVEKNWYPVTKSEKSFYFDNTSCPHSPQPCHVPILTVPLFLSHHLPLVHWSWGNPEPQSVRHFLKWIKTNVRDRNKPKRPSGLWGWGKIFGRDNGIEEPYWGPYVIAEYLLLKMIKTLNDHGHLRVILFMLWQLNRCLAKLFFVSLLNCVIKVLMIIQDFWKITCTDNGKLCCWTNIL